MAKFNIYTGEWEDKNIKPEEKTEVKQEVKTEEKPMPEDIKIRPEEIKELVEKARTVWSKIREAIERGREEKVRKILEEAGVPVVRKVPKTTLEELGIEVV